MNRSDRVGIRSGGRKGKRHTLAEKLAARTVKMPSGCWEVQGAALHSGHIHLAEGSSAKGDLHFIRAHVFAWEQVHGRVPLGMVVMHLCDNPRCVNVDHLRMGTQRDNILDSIRKGRYNVFGRQKLNAHQVREIRSMARQGVRHKDIAAQFGIKRHSVSGIVNRKSWDHLSDYPVWDEIFERVPHVDVPVVGEVS